MQDGMRRKAKVTVQLPDQLEPTEHQQIAAKLLRSGKPFVDRVPNGGPMPRVVVNELGLQLCESLTAEGLDLATIAKELGINKDTLNSAQNGKAGLADEITGHLLTALRKGHIISGFFLAKAKLGWRDNGEAPDAKPPANIVIQLPPALSRRLGQDGRATRACATRLRKKPLFGPYPAVGDACWA
jgi:hypothetical protein